MKALTCVGYTILIIGLVGLMAGCGKSDKEQIIEAVNGSLTAYENEHINKLMTYIAEDCEQIMSPFEGRPIQFSGKEVMEYAFANDFERWKDIEMVVSVGQDGWTSLEESLQEKTVGWDAGVDIGMCDYEHTYTDLDRGGVREVARGKINMTFEKIDEVWKISRVEITVDSLEPVGMRS